MSISYEHKIYLDELYDIFHKYEADKNWIVLQ